MSGAISEPAKKNWAVSAAALLKGIAEAKAAIRDRIETLCSSSAVPSETATAQSEARELQRLVEQLEQLGRLELSVERCVAANLTINHELSEMLQSFPDSEPLVH